jgi:hypothetical protein
MLHCTVLFGDARREVLDAVTAPVKGPLRSTFLALTQATGIGVMLAACSTMPVGVEFDHSARFALYHTFACLPGASYGSSDASVVQDAREAIEDELARRGLHRAEDLKTADLMVDFKLGAQTRAQVHTYPPPHGGRWWNLQDWWAHPDSAYTLDVRLYREGTLAIDVFDAHSHTLVWHGWAKKELSSSDVEHSRGLIRSAVHCILKRFPPR